MNFWNFKSPKVLKVRMSRSESEPFVAGTRVFIQIVWRANNTGVGYYHAIVIDVEFRKRPQAEP